MVYHTEIDVCGQNVKRSQGYEYFCRYVDDVYLR